MPYHQHQDNSTHHHHSHTTAVRRPAPDHPAGPPATSQQTVHSAPEPSPSDRWGAKSPPPEGAEDRFPGQTCNRTAGHPRGQTTRQTSHAPRDAPEPDSP